MAKHGPSWMRVFPSVNAKSSESGMVGCGERGVDVGMCAR